MKRTILLTATLLVLAGCQSRAPENALDEGNATEDNITVPIENVTAAPPVNITENVTEPAAPPPTFSQDEQMRDDADATGMTARLPDEPSSPATESNETRPAQ